MAAPARASRLFQNAAYVSVIAFLIGVILLLISYQIGHSSPQRSLPAEVLRDLGVVLCSIGLISLLYEMLIRRQLLTDYNDVLQRILDPDTKKLGVKALYRDRDDKSARGRSLDALLRATRKDMLCFGLGLYGLLPEKRDLLLAKLRDGCSFSFLIFNPDSNHAGALDESLGSGTMSLIHFLRAQRTYFIEFAKRADEQGLKDKVEIRTYDIVPTFGALAVDHDDQAGFLIVELYGAGVEGSVCPGVELIPKGSPWYDFYNRQLDELWRTGKPLEARAEEARPPA